MFRSKRLCIRESDSSFDGILSLVRNPWQSMRRFYASNVCFSWPSFADATEMYLTYVVNAMHDQVYDISSGRFDHKRGLDADEDSVSVFICQRNLVLYTVSLPSATVLLRIFIYCLDMRYSGVVIVFGKTRKHWQFYFFHYCSNFSILLLPVM